MAVVGTLIAESLRIGAQIEGISFAATKIDRARVGDTSAGQPLVWTLMEFEIADQDAARLASLLESALQREGGWYCDFRTDDDTFVVFADRTFRYRRGDQAGRAAAAEHARSVGVPEAQLDWPI